MLCPDFNMNIRTEEAVSRLVNSHWWRNRTCISGYDIGKRGNPSHHSVFAIHEDSSILDKDNNPIEVLIMVHQKFLDNIEYVRQVEYLKACIEFFNIQRCYVDNTRGEFDERGLPRQCIPVTLGAHTGAKSKGKMELATQFAKLIEQKRIKLIDDDRFISQICCVTNDLQAPNSPMGHGDSFISVILAVGVYYDFFAKDRRKGFSYLGDTQELISISEKRIDLTSQNLPDNICKICKNRTFDQLENGKKICTKCATIW